LLLRGWSIFKRQVNVSGIETEAVQSTQTYELILKMVNRDLRRKRSTSDDDSPSWLLLSKRRERPPHSKSEKET
jgi:hypothetical protein